MKMYEYTGFMGNLVVNEELGVEGILSGQYGQLHYKRCKDGFAIIKSHFKGSGFVCYPTSAELFIPGFINNIPVTETHQLISINNESSHPIAIEASNINRAYLTIVKKFGGYQKNQPINIDINFCKSNGAVDYCEIQCYEPCILAGVAAKHLKVVASSITLKDSAYEALEQAEFFGGVIPFIESGFDNDYINLEYFSGKKALKSVKGSFIGDTCFKFNDCTSLEKVHLSNGICQVPPYAFKNCSSLKDIYIPDTVTEIGEYAFSGCTNLQTIHLPEKLHVIPKGLFAGCSSLTKCYLSDNIEYIEDQAFWGCVSLRKPWIPKNIKKISTTAFENPEWGKF